MLPSYLVNLCRQISWRPLATIVTFLLHSVRSLVATVSCWRDRPVSSTPSSHLDLPSLPLAISSGHIVSFSRLFVLIGCTKCMSFSLLKIFSKSTLKYHVYHCRPTLMNVRPMFVLSPQLVCFSVLTELYMTTYFYE